jgi:hypothetical protein
MKRIYPHILTILIAIIISVTLMACTNGFNQEKAETLLNREKLTSSDYDELIELYSIGVDDAIRLSKEKAEELTENDRKEFITLFQIGQRLSQDKDNLSDSQQKEIEEISKKGSEEFRN